MGIAQIPAASGSKVQKVQEFTSTNTWTAPSGVFTVEVFAVGGGGGGGGVVGTGTSNNMVGGGGGGGTVKRQFISVTPGTSYTITIGAGGAGGIGASTATAAGVGNSTTFGSLLTAEGGGGANSWGNTSGWVKANAGGTFAGGGTGGASANRTVAGCGGGAGGNAMIQSDSTTFNEYYFGATALNNLNDTSAVYKVSFGSGAVTTSTFEPFAIAGPGIEGYGIGGPGGSAGIGQPNSGIAAIGSVVGTASAWQVGNSAGANTGGGGGGATSLAGNAGRNGGDGGSGYCKIMWWE